MCHWIIQDIFGDETNDFVRNLESYEVVSAKYDVYDKEIYRNTQFRGSIDFVLKSCKYHGIKPQISLEKYDCSHYYNHLNEGSLLNDDFIMLPWGFLKAQKLKIFQAFPRVDSLFIRPNSGRKVFTGTTLTKKWFDKEIDIIGSLPSSSVQNSDLVLISSVKDIISEYRVVVHEEAGIIDSVKYEGEDQEYVNHVAGEFLTTKHLKFPAYLLDFHPDVLYTIDVAFLSDGTTRVVELNSFNSAGLYGLDIGKQLDILC